jgi:fluoride exporter
VRLEGAVEYLLVGIGGFAGANARHLLGVLILERLGDAFPYGTFAVNVSGSLLIGVLLVLLTERVAADPAWRQLLVVGFLGGYTTFSSYTWEALALAESGYWGRAIWYVVGSNVAGLAAAYAGIALARAVGR